jgi:hypothetical protein
LSATRTTLSPAFWAFLEERKKQSAQNPTGFDQAVSEALKEQISRKGLKL